MNAEGTLTHPQSGVIAVTRLHRQKLMRASILPRQEDIRGTRSNVRCALDRVLYRRDWRPRAASRASVYSCSSDDDLHGCTSAATATLEARGARAAVRHGHDVLTAHLLADDADAIGGAAGRGRLRA
jgi:hypothetical protein